MAWEPLPVIESRVGTVAHDVLFLPDAPLDDGGLVWISDYGPLAYRPGASDNWDGSDWDNLCVVGCAPDEGLLSTAGTLFISAAAGATEIDRLPSNGSWERGVHGHVSALFQTTLPGLRAADGSGALYSGTYTAIRSDDDGREGSWVNLGDTSGRIEAFGEVPPSDSLPEGRLLAAVWNGVTYSDDGGVTWHAARGLYGFARYIATGFAFVPEPGHPYGGALLAGVDDLEWGRDSTATVYRSEDGGTNWTRVHRFSPSALGLANANQVVFWVAPDGVVWAGVTFERAGFTYERPGAIVRSLDGGRTWEPAQREYGLHAVEKLRPGPDGRLYAASARGVWRTKSPVFAVASGSETVPTPIGLGAAVAPNPTAGMAVVTLRLSTPVSVRVLVLDALGREAAVVHDGPTSDGERVTVETAGLAPGVYRILAEAANGASAMATFTIVR